MLKKFWKYRYLIFLFALGLTPLLWFYGRPGILITGSDTNFPLNPLVWLTRRFFVWNDVANVGENFSSSIAGVFFHLIQAIPFALGLGLQRVEIVSLVFWFLAVVFSAYVFSGVLLGKRMIPRLVLVCIYAFNVYLFNTWENVKVANLSLMVSLPLLITIYLLYTRNKISLFLLLLYSCLVGILASGSGINPAYFATLVLGFSVFVAVELIFSQGMQLRLNIIAVLATLAPMTLVNSFWIFPTLNHLIFSESSISNLIDIGFTNWLDSLSQNTSIFNVLRLQGAWDWYAKDDAGFPLYIPYALNYFKKLPFIVFSVLLTGMAFLSLVMRDKKRDKIYLGLTLMLVLGVFLGVGSHTPTGVFFEFLTVKLPFFSFFRSPWYIFTPLLVFSISSLVGLLFNRLEEKLNRTAFLLVFLVFLAGNFLYNYPLVTGKVFRPASSGSFYVKFPNYVFATGQWLNGGVNKGRVVGYPDDEIERFNWGYQGVESVINLISPVETIYSSLNQTNPEFSAVLKEFYLALKKSEVETSLNLASKMSIGWIFNKGDQSSLAPKLPKQVLDLPKTNFGLWDFYEIPDNYFLPKMYPASGVYLSYPYGSSPQNLQVVLGKDMLANPSDSVVREISSVETLEGIVVSSKNSQLEEMKKNLLNGPILSPNKNRRDLSSVNYSFSIPEDSYYTPAIEAYRLADFGIRTTGSLNVLLDGRRVYWSVNKVADYVYFNEVYLAKGDHTVTFYLRNENLASRIWSEDRSKSTFSAKKFDWMAPYVIEYKYKTIGDANPSLKISQKNINSHLKVQSGQTPLSENWQDFNIYFDPVKTLSTVSIEIENENYFSSLSLKKVFTNNFMLIKKAAPTGFSQPVVSLTKKSPVHYEAVVSQAQEPHIIVFSEKYSPDWTIRLVDKDGQELNKRPLHFTANYYANAWYFEGMPDDYKMYLYYKPQNIFYLGGIVSILTGLICVGLYLLSRTISKLKK